MPVQHNDHGRRWVEMQIEVPGSPERVWDALATGPGNTGWFVKAEIEPQVGGRLVFDFGGGATSEGEVTTWLPSHRFGYVERDWSPGAPPVATEILILPQGDNACTVRMRHEIETTARTWDADLEGFEDGWTGFFSLLTLYLAHFAGLPAGSFMRMFPAHTDGLTAWSRLRDALALTGAQVGDRHHLAPTPEVWSGVVEQIHEDPRKRWILLRLGPPEPGIVLVGTYDGGATSHAAADAHHGNVSVCRYVYGDRATEHAEVLNTAWEAWITSTFPAPPPDEPAPDDEAA